MASPVEFDLNNLDREYPGAIQELRGMPETRRFVQDLLQTFRDVQDKLNDLENRVAALEP